MQNATAVVMTEIEVADSRHICAAGETVRGLKEGRYGPFRVKMEHQGLPLTRKPKGLLAEIGSQHNWIRFYSVGRHLD